MKTKALLAVLIALSTMPTLAGAQEQPQIAYRLFSGYIDKKSAGTGLKTGGTILTSSGGIMLSAAAVAWFWGDDIAAAGGSDAWDQDAKMGTTIGLSVAGAVTFGLGTTLLLATPKDYRKDYREVFAEKDAAVREALSVAALKDLAAQGKRKRVTNAWADLLTPILYLGIYATCNQVSGRDWDSGISDGFYWNVLSVVGGVSALASKSEEERLYDKYLIGRAALYGEPGTDSSELR